MSYDDWLVAPLYAKQRFNPETKFIGWECKRCGHELTQNDMNNENCDYDFDGDDGHAWHVECPQD